METLHITPNPHNRRKVELWKDGVKVREFDSYTECAAFIGCNRSMVTRALRRDITLKGYELKTGGDEEA